jgi:hypothetical protein
MTFIPDNSCYRLNRTDRMDHLNYVCHLCQYCCETMSQLGRHLKDRHGSSIPLVLEEVEAYIDDAWEKNRW